MSDNTTPAAPKDDGAHCRPRLPDEHAHDEDDDAKKKYNRKYIIYVDVIIPVHNASETLFETVTSAMNQIVPEHLQQRLVPFSLDVAVCVYNDGSTDNSWELLKELKDNHDNANNEHAVAAAASSRNRPLDDNEDARPRQVRDIPVVPVPVPTITTSLLIATSQDGVSRGAGYARNRAASLRPSPPRSRDGDNHEDERRRRRRRRHKVPPSFLVLLDSDDIMHETRVAEQVCAMLALDFEDDSECERTIMGCTFDRDPPNSTWHYAQWANGLTDERLMLERFREVTVLQPTWIMTKTRFQSLGGYVQAPHPNKAVNEQEEHDCCWSNIRDKCTFAQPKIASSCFRLVHETFDTLASLRLAEDLRFFHSHLMANGLLRLHRTTQPLVTYRHRSGMSQSSQTPRKLLTQLRALAFERAILWCGNGDKDNVTSSSSLLWSGQFVVWGAGRDGKDFVKALTESARKRVACFVDVDERKIEAGYYVNRELDIRIPIVHFSWLAECRSDATEAAHFGKIDKGRRNTIVPEMEQSPSRKKRKEHEEGNPQNVWQKRIRSKAPPELDLALLPKLPVVVCVAMYRTNGALEANVKSIGRTEGKDLWHFS